MHPITVLPAPARCLLSLEYGAKYPHLYLKQTWCCFIICERLCVIRFVLWRTWPRLRVWCLLAPARNTCTSFLRFSAGWSISWLTTQQMFTGQPGNLFPFPWPLRQRCREDLHTGRRTTTHSSSITTKSHLGRQFQRVSSELTAFKMTSHFPCKGWSWTFFYNSWSWLS